jgi:WXG100 family type VII secretion target
MAEVSKIKMEYARMEEMAKTFQQGAEQLKDTLSQMQSIANTLQDGALLGNGGTAFADAIRNKLCPAISRLEQKFEELNKDVLVAKAKMMEADQTSQRIMG